MDVDVYLVIRTLAYRSVTNYNEQIDQSSILFILFAMLLQFVVGVPNCAVVADAILGKSNPYTDLYSPSRKLSWVPPVLPPISFTYIKNTVSVSQ